MSLWNWEPADYKKNTIILNKNSNISRTDLLKKLSHSLYSRAIDEIEPGSFRVTGDIVEVFLSYSDKIIRINFFGDEIEFIEEIYYLPNKIVKRIDSVKIFPANMFSTQKEVLNKAMDKIRIDLGKQVSYFKEISKNLEAKRLEERTLFDLEMMQELDTVQELKITLGTLTEEIQEPDRFVFLDYFDDDFLTIIDESHVTLPQIKAMYGGDRSRKRKLG